ncbi:hypothetical protein TWF730_008060 [Orbilia blumenaviensis]|uniref:Uncharacterized protein n=1 Tax=Orbilia blumenaviensis TaxID=1796055 RepID=A0AAV9VB11_9PEZI
MGFTGNGLSVKHYRLALAIASVYGAAGVYSAALLKDSTGKRRRWLYLLIFTIFICAYTIIILVGIQKYGKRGSRCVSSYSPWKALGSYSGAIGTVVVTPIWFIAMLIGLFWLSFYDKQKQPVYLRAIVFVSVAGMAIWNIVYIVGLQKFYLEYEYAYIYGDIYEQTNEVYGAPTIGQLVNYVIIFYPLVELAIAGIKRRLADRSKASAVSQEIGGDAEFNKPNQNPEAAINVEGELTLRGGIRGTS